MNRFQRILIVLSGDHDRDKVLLNRAVHLAQTNSAELICMEVVKDVPYDLKHLSLPFHFSKIQNKIIEERITKTEKLIAPYRGKLPKLDVKVSSGTPFVEIIKEVIKNNLDLVLAPAVLQSRIEKILFGSTAMHLLRKCPCPVWIVRASHNQVYKGVLAAVNATSPSFSDKFKLNKKIVELAASLASREGSELHIVNAWALHGERFLASRGHVPSSELFGILKENERQHQEWLHEVIRKVDISPDTTTHVHLIKGNVIKVIPKYVLDNHIDLIVMGTLSKTGIPGLYSSNTTEQMLQQVSCSVMAVKPEGFQ